MLKILFKLPPFISMAHVLIFTTMFFFDVKYQGSLLILFLSPIILTIFVHVIVIFIDAEITLSERIGYALVHIPFSITLSFFTMLFFIPTEDGPPSIKNTLSQCVDIDEIKCLNSFYQSVTFSKIKGLEKLKDR